MPEALELRSVIEAADLAAAGGDYVTAELKLREAAALQEAQLGPLHPDLANTLNNLGVVYERADSPAEAELCYRRAHRIATTALEPTHPFVQTSRQNLEDFCKARGRPFDRSAVPHERMPRRKPVRRSPFPIVVGGVGALGLAVLIVTAFWLRSDLGESSSAGEAQPSAQYRTSTTPGLPIEPAREPERVNTEGVTAAPLREDDSSVARRGKSVEPQSVRSVASASRAPVPSTPAAVTLGEAHLCRRLSSRDWRCDQLSSPVAPGLLFFYTRVMATNDTTVEHRWYRGDRLSQSVELRIRGSSGSGYRTYSRRTVSAENAGDWRVEVRTADGSLLHEERFVVR